MLDDSISVWFQKGVDPYAVKLFADNSAAKFFKRRALPTQKIDSIHSDGSMEFTLKITHEMEVLPIIKYWMPHLFVIEPAWLRDIIRDHLATYMEKERMYHAK